MLVISDYGFRRTARANGLTALNLLVVPALFAPFLSVQRESYAELTVIDVRNGYLYGQITATEDAVTPFTTVYGIENPQPIEYQWIDLVSTTQSALGALLSP